LKKSILMLALALIWSATLFATGTQYSLRVDGLACPFCAYGIEKKFKKTTGVDSVDFDLEKGLVIVKVGENIKLSEAQLKQLIADAGFTMRSMTEKPLLQ